MLTSIVKNYLQNLSATLSSISIEDLELLVEALCSLRNNNNTVFICGNGGSAANALHIVNDFIYGVEPRGRSIKAEALSANNSVITCLGNDLGYDKIFSHQLKVKAASGDCLIVLSGSGNSPNIISALKQANQMNVTTVAILGYNGGKAKDLADLVFHFDINDMQIAEDTQLILGHILMKALNKRLSLENIEFSKDQF